MVRRTKDEDRKLPYVPRTPQKPFTAAMKAQALKMLAAGKPTDEIEGHFGFSRAKLYEERKKDVVFATAWRAMQRSRMAAGATISLADRKLFLAEWRKSWDAHAAAGSMGLTLGQLRRLRDVDPEFANEWEEVENDRIAALDTVVTQAITRHALRKVYDDDGRVVDEVVNERLVALAQKEREAYDPRHLAARRLPANGVGNIQVVIDTGGGAVPQEITVQKEKRREHLRMEYRPAGDEEVAEARASTLGVWEVDAEDTDSGA